MIAGVAGIREAYRDDRVAAGYVDQRFREPLGRILHCRQADVLRRIVAASRPERVLEVAPGPARLTVEVAPLLARAPVVLDASAQMLATAKQRLAAMGLRASMIEGDAFQLPLAATFDLVFTFRLIRHFARAERTALYKQIARVLRPQGTLVFDVVNEAVSAPFRARAAAREHLHYDALLDQEGLARELEEGGFEILELVGVQHRFAWLQKVQVFVAPRSRRMARAAMEILDRSGGAPLEWVAVCRRA